MTFSTSTPHLPQFDAILQVWGHACPYRTNAFDEHMLCACQRCWPLGGCREVEDTIHALQGLMLWPGRNMSPRGKRGNVCLQYHAGMMEEVEAACVLKQ